MNLSFRKTNPVEMCFNKGDRLKLNDLGKKQATRGMLNKEATFVRYCQEDGIIMILVDGMKNPKMVAESLYDKEKK